jgi:4-hydroxy-tetrahydrodipicolinate synthase
MTFQALSGIVAAPFLPMLPDHCIDWDGLRPYVRWIAEQDPAAIAMNMDASEGPSLTRPEQLEVIRSCRAAIAGRVPLYSGLVCNSTADGVAFGRELRAAGAEGLAIFPPLPLFLSPPISVAMMLDFHKSIADDVGLPIVGFQFPIGMGPDLTPEIISALADAIPNLVGLKEASFDLLHTVQSIEAGRRLNRPIGILTGSDTFILEALLIGCDGALIGFAGTATDQLVRMQAAAASGDYPTAYAIWDRLGPLGPLLLAAAAPRLPPADEGGSGAGRAVRPCHVPAAAAAGRRCRARPAAPSRRRGRSAAARARRCRVRTGARRQRDMAGRPLRGVVAAPVLPMHADESVDYATLERYLDWVAAQRPAAIAMNMDASEAPSLTRDEQIEVLRASRRAIAGRVPLYSGLIARFTAEAVDWALALGRAGAEGLVVFPPLPISLGRPTPVEMLYGYHKAVAEAAKLPMIAFQQALARAPDYTPEVIRALADIPELVALKEASYDTGHTIQSIATGATLKPPIGILTGSDTFILEAMLVGCDGALIGFAATATAELVEMNDAAQRRDVATARRRWARLGPLARCCWRAPASGYPTRLKEVLVMQGLLETATVRRPRLGIGEAERSELRRLAALAGLLDRHDERAV